MNFRQVSYNPRFLEAQQSWPNAVCFSVMDEQIQDASLDSRLSVLDKS